MKVLKNILEVVVFSATLVSAILFLSVTGAFAESKKSALQNSSKYEVKSEIINFNYQEMAYPINTDCKIGIVSESLTGSKVSAPKKIVPGKPQEPKNPLIDGILLFISLVICTLIAIGVSAIFPTLVVIAIITIISSIRKKNSEKS